jgi:lipopolysaccharide biosynthesis regulator YciM
MAGVSAIDKADNAAAEQQLKKAADTDKDTAAMAKFTLANLYRSEGKTDDAAKLYREVIDADRLALPQSEAQQALAEMYETKNPAEAVKVYEQIIKQEQEKAKEFLKQNPDPKAKLEDLKSPLQQEAEAKIANLKSAAGKK